MKNSTFWWSVNPFPSLGSSTEIYTGLYSPSSYGKVYESNDKFLICLLFLLFKGNLSGSTVVCWVYFAFVQMFPIFLNIILSDFLLYFILIYNILFDY